MIQAMDKRAYMEPDYSSMDSMPLLLPSPPSSPSKQVQEIARSSLPSPARLLEQAPPPISPAGAKPISADFSARARLENEEAGVARPANLGKLETEHARGGIPSSPLPAERPTLEARKAFSQTTKIDASPRWALAGGWPPVWLKRGSKNGEPDPVNIERAREDCRTGVDETKTSDDPPQWAVVGGWPPVWLKRGSTRGHGGSTKTAKECLSSTTSVEESQNEQGAQSSEQAAGRPAIDSKEDARKATETKEAQPAWAVVGGWPPVWLKRGAKRGELEPAKLANVTSIGAEEADKGVSEMTDGAVTPRWAVAGGWPPVWLKRGSKRGQSAPVPLAEDRGQESGVSRSAKAGKGRDSLRAERDALRSERDALRSHLEKMTSHLKRLEKERTFETIAIIADTIETIERENVASVDMRTIGIQAGGSLGTVHAEGTVLAEGSLEHWLTPRSAAPKTPTASKDVECYTVATPGSSWLATPRAPSVGIDAISGG